MMVTWLCLALKSNVVRMSSLPVHFESTPNSQVTSSGIQFQTYRTPRYNYSLMLNSPSTYCYPEIDDSSDGVVSDVDTDEHDQTSSKFSTSSEHLVCQVHTEITEAKPEGT